MHPQGRVRYAKLQDENGDYTGEFGFVYDYFIKDHLGSIRTVITDQQLVNKYPAATLETSRLASERNYYNIADGRCVAKSLTGASQSSFESKLYRTNGGNNEKTGLGITLKVMAGDKVYIKAESFYKKPSGTGVGTSIPIALTELANAFLSSSVMSSGKDLTTGTITGNTPSANNITNFLSNDRTPATSQTPRSYLNWVLFDEQFQFVAGGIDPVKPDGGYKLHDIFVTNPVEITKNGYLFVYCSNESDLNVFFDNLQLTHIQGPLEQENSYYPYGMSIMALSSKAANGLQNGYKFNGINEEDNFDLDLYAAYYRVLDPQLGRWWQLDPAIEKYPGVNGYNFAFNDPANIADPWGDDPGWLIRLLNGSLSGGSLPEVVVTATRTSGIGSDMLGKWIVDDLGRIAYHGSHAQEKSNLRGSLDVPTLPLLGLSSNLILDPNSSSTVVPAYI